MYIDAKIGEHYLTTVSTLVSVYCSLPVLELCGYSTHWHWGETGTVVDFAPTWSKSAQSQQRHQYCDQLGIFRASYIYLELARASYTHPAAGARWGSCPWPAWPSPARGC